MSTLIHTKISKDSNKRSGHIFHITETKLFLQHFQSKHIASVTNCNILTHILFFSQLNSNIDNIGKIFSYEVPARINNLYSNTSQTVIKTHTLSLL